MAEDVPGIFIKIAGILPPNVPPVNIAVKNSMACIKLIYRVTGKNIAIAIDICSPGIAPKIKPISMPGITISQGVKLLKSKFRPLLSASKSIIAVP